MFLIRGLSLAILLISCLLSASSGEDSKEVTSKEVIDQAAQDTFSKRGGRPDDVPDQIAIESNHEPVEHRGEGGHGRPIPVPVPMRGHSGTIVLPLPPGFNAQGGPQGGPHGQGNPIGIRIPGPHSGPQGQYSAPRPQMLPPGSGERLNFQKSKEVYAGSGPSHTQLHQNHHLSHQKVHEHVKQQVQQHIHQQASGEAGIHPNHKPAQGFNQLPPPGLTQPKIMVPPAPAQYDRPPIRGDQGQPKPPQGYQGQDAQLANSIFRELFDRQKKPQHQQQQHGNQYAGGPQQQNFVGRPQHPSDPLRAHKTVSGNDLQAAGGQFPSPAVQYGGVLGANPSGPWPEVPDTDMPKIVSLEVKCEKSVMRVYIAFDKPFNGVIFSKGHYHNVHCIHLPAGLGHTSANFDIGIDSCGTQGNTENGLYGYGQQSGSGSFFENIIVIQYDPQVQEVWDQARKLRCTWHDQYEKSVTFRPFPVDMLDVVRADFAGDNVGCWMQIQVGKGPWASEVSGLVKIGQSMTMVLAIKDDDNKFDMLVRNCMAHDGVRAPVQLVDQWGCVTRPKLMSRFTKIKNFGQSASVLSYAHFQAFKFPDSMEVHFQCTIQICRYQCPEQCTQPTDGAAAGAGGYAGHIGKSGLPAPADREEARRRRRAVLNETSDDIIEFSTTFRAIVPGSAETNDKENVGLNRVITVVSDGDLDFIGGKSGDQNEDGVPIVEASEIPGDIVCMSTFGFASMLIVLIGTLLIACIFSAVIVLRRPRKTY